jgi:ribosome-associated protein
MPDVRKEMRFKTARSGGKGGQHVNKVETLVEGYWNIAQSRLFSDEQQALLSEKLSKKLNEEGELVVRCSQTRSQLENKEIAIRKMNQLIEKALIPVKQRKATKPTKASKIKRLESKKKTAEKKESRKKIID